MFFYEGSDDFFVDLDGAREANRFTRQSFNTGTERQVIALYVLREDLAGHHVDMVGFNIKCATTRDVFQAKIAAGELQSLNDQFGSIQYRFT